MATQPRLNATGPGAGGATKGQRADSVVRAGDAITTRGAAQKAAVNLPRLNDTNIGVPTTITSATHAPKNMQQPRPRPSVVSANSRGPVTVGVQRAESTRVESVLGQRALDSIGSEYAKWRPTSYKNVRFVTSVETALRNLKKPRGAGKIATSIYVNGNTTVIDIVSPRPDAEPTLQLGQPGTFVFGSGSFAKFAEQITKRNNRLFEIGANGTGVAPSNASSAQTPGLTEIFGSAEARADTSFDDDVNFYSGGDSDAEFDLGSDIGLLPEPAYDNLFPSKATANEPKKNPLSLRAPVDDWWSDSMSANQSAFFPKDDGLGMFTDADINKPVVADSNTEHAPAAPAPDSCCLCGGAVTPTVD